MINTIKNVGPWLVAILMCCVMIDITLQHSKLLHDKQVLQQQVDSLRTETDSLIVAVKTREQINNKLIQTLK